MAMGMQNKFLIRRALFALAWLLASGFAPSARSADSGPSATSNNTDYSGPIPEMRRAPVPLVRKVPATPRGPIPVVEPTARSVTPAAEPTGGLEPAEPTARDQFDSNAAKAAVEADGYKRVTVLGKGPNGAWRAKGYRGTTEVELIVDGIGKVTMD
jgi:hypothetical protein